MYWPDVCREGGWSDFAFAVRTALGSRCAALDGLGFVASVSQWLPLLFDGDLPRPFGSRVPLTERGDPSNVPIGSTPGPTLLRGARAAGFCGALGSCGTGAGNWLWRLVRMAMFIVCSEPAALSGGGGGAVVGGGGGWEGFVMPGLRVLDWLKRRMKELLRSGCASFRPARNGCMLGVALLGGAVLLKLPGAGKSLRLGS